ncbi:MAG: hypothetical protein HW419_1237 [Deltaproteobacteria bacterium]|nr:hypothetical protein [Deltaproteobacteria bacterium]
MGNRIADIGKLRSQVDAENRAAIFDGKKSAKLGSKKNPAVVTVQTEKRLKEVTAAFAATGWNYKIRLDPDKPEDIADLTRLRNPPKPMTVEKKAGRNEPCPCGSGKKYKNCCSQ